MAERPELAWRGDQVVAGVHDRLEAGMRRAMDHAVAAVKADLFGAPQSPPGSPPGRVDGDLVDSIGATVRRSNDGVVASVGAIDDAEQLAKGARLAGGFVGRDARGRIYAQPARPWLVPTIRRELATIVRLLVGR